jgi:putative ABC transport system permease protein
MNMRWRQELSFIVRRLIHRRRAERELEEEIRAHLEMEIERNVVDGMAPEEARMVARRSFGSVALAKEDSRAMWGLGSLETLWQDLRYGLRTLLKNPGFTTVAILTLALGIGANTAIFSVVNGVLLKSLPFPESERLLELSETSKDAPVMMVAYPNYLDWRARQTVFEDLAARYPAGGVLTGDGEPERVFGRWVTASFFPTLGVKPHLGRFFNEEEDKPGATAVIVLGYDLWQRRFGADPNLIGKTVFYNSEIWTVVGVTPADFDFYGQNNLSNDFFIPLGRQGADWEFMGDRRSHTVWVTARLKPGVAIDQARAQMKSIAVQLEKEYPASNTGAGVGLTSFLDNYVGRARYALLVISGAVAIVLLIACANVANLLLARAAARRKEMAIRLALGAGRFRVVRQLLTESMLLALAGGALGLLLAFWGVELLVRLAPDSLPRMEEITIDPRALGFTALVTLLTGIIFGLTPALQTSKVDLNDTLTETGRQASGGAGARRLRGALVVAEIALSLSLLVGAGLLLKSFRRLMEVDPGFDARNVLTLRLRLPDVKYREAAQATGFLKEASRRIAAFPGVREVSVATGFPLGRTLGENGYWIEDQPEPQMPGDWPVALTQSVSESFHRALGVTLLAGRYFTEGDIADAPPVALVDDHFVRRHFPNGSINDALGKRLRFGGDGEVWREIVGVVRHVRHNSLEVEGFPQIYSPWLQMNPRLLADWARVMDMIVKTSGSPMSLVAPIKREVQAMDKDQPMGAVRTLESLVAQSIAPRRFNLLLLGIFAFIALLLGAVGLYGVMSYAVTQRTRELGIRIALGAQKSDALWLVIKQGMLLSLIGIMTGLAASFALTRLMTSLLYDVSATDPLTFSSIALLLGAVALLACWIPARRATKVDPLTALKHE